MASDSPKTLAYTIECINENRTFLTNPLVCIQSTHIIQPSPPLPGTTPVETNIIDLLQAVAPKTIYLFARPGTLTLPPTFIQHWQKEEIARIDKYQFTEKTSRPFVKDSEYYQIIQKIISRFDEENSMPTDLILWSFDMHTMYITRNLLHTLQHTAARLRNVEVVGSIPSIYTAMAKDLAHYTKMAILNTVIPIYGAITDAVARQIALTDPIIITLPISTAIFAEHTRPTQARTAQTQALFTNPASLSGSRATAVQVAAIDAQTWSFHIPTAAMASVTVAVLQHIKYAEAQTAQTIAEFVATTTDAKQVDSKWPRIDDLPRRLQQYITSMARLIAHTVALDGGLAGPHRYVSPIFQKHAQLQILLASNAIAALVREGNTDDMHPAHKRPRPSRLAIQ